MEISDTLHMKIFISFPDDRPFRSFSRCCNMRLPITMLPLILVAIFSATAYSGTLCPPREDIYPCNCRNIPINKRAMHTTVQCHHLPDSSALSKVLHSLKPVHIDQFHIYNSFWDAHGKGLTAKAEILPTDWLTLLRIKEMEIYDSALSSGFACQMKLECKNNVTTRFSLVNSSLSDNMWTLCLTEKGNAYPWITCMNRLKHFEYTHGKLVTFGFDMFPLPMRELLVLNLTHNEIASVHRDALKNLKKLSMLDLSYNSLESIDFVNTDLNNLEFLDLSWNRIKDIGSNQFGYLKGLKSLILVGNDIVDLKETTWKSVSSSMTIDLAENLLHCGCNIRWIKEQPSKDFRVKGVCTTPEEYKGLYLRVAANAVHKKYDENCNLKSNKTTTIAP